MVVEHRNEVVKCPNENCQNPIRISIGRWRGGINDSGGWVLKCAKCDHIFPIDVKSPDDASSVDSGATILASWDDDLGNRAEILEANGVIDKPEQVERLLLLQHGKPEDFYDLRNR